MFYSNFNYITTSVINSEWDEIMELYKKVLEKNPNYKNSRLMTLNQFMIDDIY